MVFSGRNRHIHSIMLLLPLLHIPYSLILTPARSHTQSVVINVEKFSIHRQKKLKFHRNNACNLPPHFRIPHTHTHTHTLLQALMQICQLSLHVNPVMLAKSFRHRKFSNSNSQLASCFVDCCLTLATAAASYNAVCLEAVT